jgi:hypothetical protein
VVLGQHEIVNSEETTAGESSGELAANLHKPVKDILYDYLHMKSWNSLPAVIRESRAGQQYRKSWFKPQRPYSSEELNNRTRKLEALQVGCVQCEIIPAVASARDEAGRLVYKKDDPIVQLAEITPYGQYESVTFTDADRAAAKYLMTSDLYRAFVRLGQHFDLWRQLPEQFSDGELASNRLIPEYVVVCTNATMAKFLERHFAFHTFGPKQDAEVEKRDKKWHGVADFSMTFYARVDDIMTKLPEINDYLGELEARLHEEVLTLY